MCQPWRIYLLHEKVCPKNCLAGQFIRVHLPKCGCKFLCHVIHSEIMIKTEIEIGTRTNLVETGTTGWGVIGIEIETEIAVTLIEVRKVIERTWSVIVTARIWTKREIETETAAMATVIEEGEEMRTQERGVALEEEEERGDRGVAGQGGVATEDKVRIIMVEYC